MHKKIKLKTCSLLIQTTIYKINNKDLQYSTRNYIQYLIVTYNGKGPEKEKKKNIYIYKTEQLCYTPQTLLTQLYFNLKRYVFKKANKHLITY